MALQRPVIHNTGLLVHEPVAGGDTLDPQYVPTLNVLTTAQPVPALTGNVTNLNAAFTDIAGGNWVVDQNGDAIRVGASLAPKVAKATGNTALMSAALGGFNQAMPYITPSGPIDPAFMWDPATFEWIVTDKGVYFYHARIFFTTDVVVDGIPGTGRPNLGFAHVVDVNFGMPSVFSFRGERMVIHNTTPQVSNAIALVATFIVTLNAGDRIRSRIFMDANATATSLNAQPAIPTSLSFSEITRLYTI